MPVNIQTPMCDKISQVANESNAIGSFIEWIQMQKFVFAKWHSHIEACWDDDNTFQCDLSENKLYPERISIEKMLAQYFEIDLEQADREKVAILASLRT